MIIQHMKTNLGCNAHPDGEFLTDIEIQHEVMNSLIKGLDRIELQKFLRIVGNEGMKGKQHLIFLEMEIMKYLFCSQSKSLHNIPRLSCTSFLWIVGRRSDDGRRQNALGSRHYFQTVERQCSFHVSLRLHPHIQG